MSSSSHRVALAKGTEWWPQSSNELVPPAGDTLLSMTKDLGADANDSSYLMNALDEIARLHPFVTVAVLAFKTAYKLQSIRRENDRRIQALYSEMKDMIIVLLHLKSIRSIGTSIKSALEVHVNKAAVDIKQCANACDTYSKKRLLVKVLLGHIWEAKFITLGTTFAEHRIRFHQILAMHVSAGIDVIRVNLGDIEKSLQQTNAQLKTAFERFVPEELSLFQKTVKAKGNLNTLLRNGQALEELNEEENRLSLRRQDGSKVRYTVDNLKDELKCGLDALLQRNYETFQEVFEISHKQQHQELVMSIEETSTRVIAAVKEGPHDRIKNDELRALWRDMGWKLNVKTRLFVMTLQDYFNEKVQEKSDDPTNPHDKPVNTDDWAVQFISLAWLQPITEALDENGSGYISIVELNRFTDSMPRGLGWSLQHWIAYWAAGWQYAATVYIEKIKKTVDILNALRPHLLLGNRSSAESYLQQCLSIILLFVAGLAPSQIAEDVGHRFDDFIEYEVDRIRQNLETIHYTFKNVDSVYAVTGPGKIAKYIFPLAYLLLERTLKLFQISRHRELGIGEFDDAMRAMSWTFSAMSKQKNHLKDLFQLQKSDVQARFQLEACGLFRYLHAPDELRSSPIILEKYKPRPVTDEDMKIDAPLTDLLKVLNKPLLSGSPYKTVGYESSELFSLESYDIDTTILSGRWNGFNNGIASSPMRSFTLRADTQVLQGQEFHPNVLHSFILKGNYSTLEDGRKEVGFALLSQNGKYCQYFKGYLGKEGYLTGYYGYTEQFVNPEPSLLFTFYRIPAELVACRPPPTEFAENKARALWMFVRNALMLQSRRMLFSWSFFKSRRDQRRRFLTLNMRNSFRAGPPLTNEELSEIKVSSKLLAPADYILYQSQLTHLMRTTPKHGFVRCDACSLRILGTRVICLDCVVYSVGGTMDFCPDPRCYSKIVHREDPVGCHEPTHKLLKVRTELQWYELNWMPGEKMKLPYLNLLDMDLSQRNHSIPRAQCCSICSGSTGSMALLWRCTVCTDCVICDLCETNSLLRCISGSCNRVYEQPSWYYGCRSGSKDRFQCGACTVKGVELHEDLGDVIRHTYVHPLVSCRSSDASLEHESNESVMSESIANSTLLSLLKGLPPLIKDCTPEQMVSVQQAFDDLNNVIMKVGGSKKVYR